MKYFGGLGAGKGWYKFKFIITPQEMETLCRSFNGHFVITNTRVVDDYSKTETEDFLTAYKNFYEKILISDTAVDRKNEWELERGIRLSIIDDISKISFTEIKDKNEFVSKKFKLVEPNEPVINIAPFYLYLSADKKLSVAFSNPEGIIGLELTYPKVVSTKDDEFSIMYDSSEMSTGLLFHEIVTNIKKMTHKAKIASPNTLYKPDFWVSNEILQYINENKYLKANKMIIS